MKIRKLLCILLYGLFLIFMITYTGWTVDTDITVRVKSKDAKFIGTSMGGVLITIKNLDTGEVLATGLTKGSTGDTKRIMNTPVRRGKPLSNGTSAKFTTTLNIDDPTLVEIKAKGPLAQRQSSNSVSITQWILPGKDITSGDALMLELPGFVVDILSPPAHIKYGGAPQSIKIKANVTMMCGCPIKPNGIWDANKFAIEALIRKDGKNMDPIKMTYAGEISQFFGDYTALTPGIYEVMVYAFDESNGNTGLDWTTFEIK